MMAQVIADRWIGCDACGGNALCVDAALSVSELDRISAECEECHCLGRVIVDTDEEIGSVRAMFRPDRLCPRCTRGMNKHEPKHAKRCGDCLDATPEEWAAHDAAMDETRESERYCEDCWRWVPLERWVPVREHCRDCSHFNRVQEDLDMREHEARVAFDRAELDRLKLADRKHEKVQHLRKKARKDGGKWREKGPTKPHSKRKPKDR